MLTVGVGLLPDGVLQHRLEEVCEGRATLGHARTRHALVRACRARTVDIVVLPVTDERGVSNAPIVRLLQPLTTVQILFRAEPGRHHRALLECARLGAHRFVLDPRTLPDVLAETLETMSAAPGAAGRESNATSSGLCAWSPPDPAPRLARWAGAGSRR